MESTNKIMIGICGAPSSGKTTVAQLLRWKIRDVTELSREVPREYARHYMEKYGKINNINQQLLIYDGQTKSEKQIMNTYDITISDSPRFLSYIYSKRFYDYNNPHNRAALVSIYELALESLMDYDIIYLLPPPDEVEQDGIRSQSNQDIDNLFNDMKNFLETHCKNLLCFINDHDKNNYLKTVYFIINDLLDRKLC